jgi:hypothetical protein
VSLLLLAGPGASGASGAWIASLALAGPMPGLSRARCLLPSGHGAVMKRAVFSAVCFAAIAALGGCPIYSHDDDGCWRDRDCESGYLCDDSSGVCYLPSSISGRCVRPSDCDVNQTCNSASRCVSGDCSFSGCVSGYHCDGSTRIWQCISDGTPNGGAGGSSSAGGAPQDSSAGAAGLDISMEASGAGGDAAVLGIAGEAGGG